MESSIFTQLVVPACLFLIMFGMGLSLTISNFTRVLKFPLAVLVGVFGQIALLPVIGFLVAFFYVEDKIVAMGIMLLAACPGGTTSNVVSYLAKGDVALSVTLTAISSVLTIVSIPLILMSSFSIFVGEGMSVEVPATRIIAVLFLITILPVSLGMFVRNKSVEFAHYFEPKISTFSTYFLIVLIGLIVYREQDVIFGSFSEAWMAAVLLNFSTMVLAYYCSQSFGLPSQQVATLTVEVGIQNSTLAIVLATSLLSDSALAIVPAIYTLVMYMSGGMLIFARRRHHKHPLTSRHTGI